MDRAYFIVDGSHLFSSIHEVWRKRPSYLNRKLNINALTQALRRKWSIHVGPVTRVTYYFKESESRIRTMLTVPQSEIPEQKDHWHIAYCGKNLRALPDSQRERLSPQYRDYFARGEKGLDIKLACDALVLASAGRASHMVFLVNDRDFLPLFEAIQYFGVSTYLTALDSKQKVRKELAILCDRYITLDSELDSIFGVVEQPGTQQVLEQIPATGESPRP